jgi:hypothetical protein
MLARLTTAGIFLTLPLPAKAPAQAVGNTYINPPA